MKALVSSPTVPGLVEFAEVDRPDDAPAHVVVKVQFVSINRGEVNALRVAGPGTRPGWDVAGVTTTDVAEIKAGTRVVGFVPEGAWAELVSIRLDDLAVVPPSVELSTAVALPVAGLTALRTLALGGDLRGRRVLITGASGGVGGIAVQLAEQSGAIVDAISRSDGASDLLSCGASNVVPRIDDCVEEYDLILESVGGASLGSALGRVVPGGVVVTFGNSSGEETAVDIRTFYRRSGARIVAFALTSPQERHGFGRDLAHLLALVEGGSLDPRVTAIRPWSEAPEAIESFLDRHHGKSVLRVDGSGH